MLLATDKRARKANERFFRALAGREREIANICGKPYVFSNKNIPPEEMESDLPKYHNIIDGQNIHIIEEIKADYKRRQGNLVLNLAKFIKPEYYENKRKRKAGDNSLKRSLGISRRNTGVRSGRKASISSATFIFGCARSRKKWSANEKNKAPQETTAKQSKTEV